MKTFAAGNAWDSQRRPAPYWLGSIEYDWDQKKKRFRIQTEQAFGFGSVYNYTSNEGEVKTSEELDKVFQKMKWLERHYKKIYRK